MTTVSVHRAHKVRAVITAATLVLGALIWTGARAPIARADDPSSATQASPAQLASDAIKRINIERQNRGLPALTVDSSINSKSQAWADQLRANNSGLPHSGAQMEIVGNDQTTARAHTAFMQSSQHRQILLNSFTTRIGAGASCTSSGSTFYLVVQFEGDNGVYQEGQAQDPIVGGDAVKPSYKCTQAAPPTTAKPTPTTQKPPSTTQPPSTTPPTTQKPPSTTQPTTATTQAPTPTSQPTGGTTPSTAKPETTTTAPPVTAPPPPPPPPAPPGQATLAIAPGDSTAGQAVQLGTAGSCPTSGTHSLAVLDPAGQVIVATSTKRQTFGGSTAPKLLIPADTPAGAYTVALVCADNTTASAIHVRRPAPSSSPGSDPSSAGGTPGAGGDPAQLDPATITPVSIDTEAVRGAAQAAKAKPVAIKHDGGGINIVIPGLIALVVVGGGLFLLRRLQVRHLPEAAV